MRTFANDKTEALNDIDRLPLAALFDRLRTDLPSDETRQYVVKVTGHRKEFVSAPVKAMPAMSAPAAAPGGPTPATAATQTAKKS
jgi:hypothetical protein